MRDLLWRFVLGIASLFICFQLSGQDQFQPTEINNPDSVFFVARELAFQGDFDASRNLCYPILKSYPEYHDARILIARTLGWENQFDSAIHVLQPVFFSEPDNHAAIMTLTDLKLWQEEYEEALKHVDDGLGYHPEDSALTQKRTDILERMNQAERLKPGSQNYLMNDSNAVGLSYYFDFFRKPYIARRHIFSFNYTRQIQYGPLTGRINIGDNVLNGQRLFGDPSYQFELDYYPKISNDSYLYLNYGYAIGDFFPLHRAGFEWFKGLPKGFEVSLGTRYLYWDHSILFFTGSLSKYFGSYWLSVRPYFAGIGKNFATVFTIELRRYLINPYSYAFLSLGFGDSPDQPLTLAEQVGNFKSTDVRGGIRYRLSEWYVGAAIGYQYEEYLTDQYRNRFTYSISVAYVF